MKGAFKRQKWINIAICFLMIFIGLGFCSANKGLFLAAICNALGLKRTLFSFSTSCRYIITSIINVFFGYLVAKLGIKKLISIGLIFLGISMTVNSFAVGVEGFILGEIFSGIGFSLTGTSMVGCVVNRWSPEKKGTIMGAVLCANGIGGAIAAQILNPLIYQENNLFGYRDAYRLLALLLLLVLVIILIWFREKPEKEIPAAAVPVEKKKSSANQWAGIALSQAIKKPCFYLALVCIFFTGFCLQGITGIATAHMYDTGLDTGFVGAIASLALLALTGSKFLAGVMCDKFGIRKTITLCCTAGIICMLALAGVSAAKNGKILAVVYAVCSSIALPLETVMLPLYAGELFGNHSYEKIMGIFISASTAGYAVGTPFVNLGYDLTGSYVSVLMITALIMLGVTVGMQFVIVSARRLRQSKA